MENLVHEIIANGFVRNLKALKNNLIKARTHAENNKFAPEKYLDMKLAPDMFPLLKQIQIATDTAKGAAARLANAENITFQDNETTWNEVIERVEKTIQFVSKFKAEDFKNWTEQKITFPWYPGKALTGKDYLVGYAIPNVYFHMTTTYSMLRQCGVQIGKGDFLGEVPWIDA